MPLESVPIIDIAPLLCPDADGNHNQLKDDCIEEIKAAARDWGFFYISNHGISRELIAAFRKDMDTFFHLSGTILDKIRRNEENSRGYFDDELTKNKLDWKRCFDFGAQNGHLDEEGMDGMNQWPSREEHATFEVTMKEYFYKMENLSETLLSALCESLGMKSDILKEDFEGNHTSYLRLNYYPKCPTPEENLAVHHHTDAGALTILYQDPNVTSLQVFKDDSWHYISPQEGTFVINIGDMMQVWSNDVFIAPLHQVQANSDRERYSAPFFYNPAYKADVKPISVPVPGVVSIGDSCSNFDEEVALYKTVNWGKFRGLRFAGDFADVGEEVQISHYRIHR
jgi:isopenicillin N synthase-like dioxygenase